MNESQDPGCTITIDIPFHDVDMLERVWHGHYFKYFELARTALLRQYGYDIPGLRDMGYYMVVIDSRCRYLQPIKYGDRIQVSAAISELEFRIKVDYRITCARSGRRLAKGTTVQATVRSDNGELCLVTPDEIVKIFQKSPHDC